jgi:hypothetical protein
MANSNGWGDGSVNNNIGWGQGANNAIGWGDIHADSWAGATDIVGITTPPFDPDAQAFITAASITDPTQQAAINTLVVDLKGYNVWTKMKALYPFVGGTNAQHSWNLKNTAQYQISWFGGVTSSSNGIQFGGVNGYGDTGLNAASVLGQDSTHFSFYSRTDVIANSVDMGISSVTRQLYLLYRYGSSAFKAMNRTQAVAGSLYTPTTGLLIANRPSSATEKYYHKGTLVDTITTASTGTISANVYIGGYNNLAAPTSREYSSKQSALISIGDGLTDTEAANFYTAVQAFQTTLGRSIGTQTVSDADAQAFVTNAGIVDQVEANAINNLVIGMKADGLWTKMKGLWPFVGSTASQHKWNLKDPRDLDAAFRLVFNGGGTHSVNGYLPNGTNAYANTFLTPSTSLTLNNSHLSFYSRTNTTVNGVSIGSFNNVFTSANQIQVRWTDGNLYGTIDNATALTVPNTDSIGNYIVTRTANNVIKAFKNNSLIVSNNALSVTLNSRSLFIGARNEGLAVLYDNRQCAFASIGDGLTDTEAANFYTRVQNFNTALARQV